MLEDNKLKLSIVIGTKDRPESLKKCLGSISTQTRPPDEILIIDDGRNKADVNSMALDLKGARVSYFNKSDNPGISKSRNLGASKAAEDIVMFLDDDVILDESYIEEIMNVFEKDNSKSIYGCEGILMSNKNNIFKRMFLKLFFLDSDSKEGKVLNNGMGILVRGIKSPIEVDWISGCNMNYRREVFREFSFDENFIDNGWVDDRDFSFRVSRKYLLYATPLAKVKHAEDPRSRINRLPFGFIEIRHNLLFFKKNIAKHFLNWISFWWAMLGIFLKNCLSCKFRQAIGNLKGIIGIILEIIVKYLIISWKKFDNLLTIFSLYLVKWTGKSKKNIHPKHLVKNPDHYWYLDSIAKKDIILDIGCGNGVHTVACAKKCQEVWGIDYNQKQLKIAEEWAAEKDFKNIHFILKSAEEQFSFPDKFFDKILLLDVIEHIKERKGLLKEIKRVLKDDGVVLIAYPNSETSWKKFQKRWDVFFYSDDDHKIEYQKGEIEEELGAGGLVIDGENKPVVMDIWFPGVIDLVGGLSLSLYKQLLEWKQKKALMHQNESIGFRILARKKNGCCNSVN